MNASEVSAPGGGCGEYEAEADVVIVGFGAAGVAAAIAAAEAGASVLVLEKLPVEAHTPSASYAGSMIMLANDVDDATRYLERCADGAVGRAECRAWAEGAAGLEGWIRDRIPEVEVHPLTGHHGGALYPEFDGGSAVVTKDFREPGNPAGSGEWLFRRLAKAMEETGRVEIRWGVRAGRLLRTEGRVDGVAWEDAGRHVQVRARRAVILSTGGFENDEELRRTYLRAWPMYFAGNPANTGDGLRMAQAMGAGLWHMQVAIGRQAAHFELDGVPCTYQMGIVPGAFVVVDGTGRRFCDESAYVRIHTTWAEIQAWDTRDRGFSKIPAYWVFDSRRFATRLAAGPEPQRSARSRWSDDNRAELERGWVVSAPTVRELAERLDMDEPDVLDSEVRAYNEAIGSGGDAWGREGGGSTPLDEGPFYAVRIFPGGVNTSGGPRHDERGRVVDAFGDPIEGLFAAGSVSQLIGSIYPSPGGGWSEALVTGAIAGTEAAQCIG